MFFVLLFLKASQEAAARKYRLVATAKVPPRLLQQLEMLLGCGQGVRCAPGLDLGVLGGPYPDVPPQGS